MRYTLRFRLLAAGALLLPSASGAQAPQPTVPPAKVRELATIEGDVSGFVRLPSGGVLIFEIADSAFTYDIATKRRTLLGTDMYPVTVSSQGDRLAFSRSSEDRTEHFIWTMPIDPRTGIGTAPAHRVGLRPMGSRSARFSPDGRTLAYRAGLLSDTTWDITLVPATGGAEHVVASFPDREAFAWALDGKSLYVEGGGGPGAIVRVPIAGGPVEPLFPRTALTEHWVVGLSPDARVALFQDNPDRFYYRTAAGVEGGIPVALPPLDDGWGHDFSLEAMRYATMTKLHHSTVRILDLASGKARDLLPGNEPTSAPAWSPDGRRLAVLIGNLSNYEIAIMNADGSGQRRYPLPPQMDGWGNPWVRSSPWSPDGHYIAVLVRDRRRVGSNDHESQLALLDVNTGATRLLADAFLGNFGGFVWRPDGKAIRIMKATPVPASPTRWSIVEYPLDGPERQLRDISAEFPRPWNIIFVSDHEVALATSRDKRVWYVAPLDGGPARRLSDPGAAEPGLQMGEGKIAGNRLMIAQVDGRVNEAKVITVLSMVGDPTRTVRLPYAIPNIGLLPDGTQIVTVGRAAGDSAYKFFVGPFDGSSTRAVGTIPRGTGGPLAPSPDGKFLAYTSEGRYTSQFFELDFGPVLQALMKP